ncbi:OLC1v1004647C1 [Oldenlandia corymbosa var. corymbosa]|uniref:non-specific serine/threonine protein kinase n=1 Tax=Oldenlandia corymbosa var. corymbosa TaxID=529605 RepID=A0AAV1DF78_OLDCO|nr:OLC1v1004647C1 [Oldenlandia corymbosa var. corymbosa]
MATVVHYNFGPADPNKVIRYPDDHFDRQWKPYPSVDAYSPISNSRVNINIADCGYYPPQAAMQTAITPVSGVNISLSISLPDPSVAYYFYIYFSEIAILQSNESRVIDSLSPKWQDWVLPLTPQYAMATGMWSWYSSPSSTIEIDLEKFGNSSLPPILNAIEVYSIKKFQQSQTDEKDVGAILNIKSTYGVQRNWQGDPCLPSSSDGLDCFTFSDKSVPPRIKSLNLSSSGLAGNVSVYLSNLMYVEQLDLSNNHLTGAIPDFLANLSQLNLLYLSGNNFSGSIPQRLLDMAKRNLKLRVDGYAENEPGPPNSSGNGQCKRERSQNFVVPVVSVMASLVVLALLIAIIMLRRTRKHQGNTNRKDGFIEPKNMQFTYPDILKMTNNFQRVLGKGFGTVYHGLTADGKQVAVKLLSSTSAQGYREFQTEAELLTRVHHRNLTSLIGYCLDDDHMSLVYEYMAYGNLREHLSATDGNVLTWSKRLQIALDAAQGEDPLLPTI